MGIRIDDLEQNDAKFIATLIIEATRYLSDIPATLSSLSLAHQREIGIEVAKVIGHLQLNILEAIFQRFPDIKEEFDKEIQRYGRVF